MADEHRVIDRLPTGGLSDDAVALRPLTPDDAPWLLTASTDPDVVAFTDIPSAWSQDDADAWIAKRLDDHAAPWRACFVVLGDDVPAGYLNLRINWGLATGQLGYWLLGRYRGRGLITAACALVRDWSFDRLGLARLELSIRPDNLASIGVAERLGATREGLLRSSELLQGVRHDQLMFSILPTDPRP